MVWYNVIVVMGRRLWPSYIGYLDILFQPQHPYQKWKLTTNSLNFDAIIHQILLLVIRLTLLPVSAGMVQ
jgi:hypothetical protein